MLRGPLVDSDYLRQVRKDHIAGGAERLALLAGDDHVLSSPFASEGRGPLC